MIPVIWYFFSAHIPHSEALERLLCQFQSFEEIWQHCDQFSWCGCGLSSASWQRLQRVHLDQSQYDRYYEDAKKKGITIITWLDGDYPVLLRQIFHPPLVLAIAGDRKILARTALAIVGTRQATVYGKAMVQGLIEVLAPYQLVFVSGLAFGIDSEVHRLAHELNIPSIGVIASHLGASDWGGNRYLRLLLADSDVLFLSETTTDERLRRYHFARRNRLIAGLCQWTIVVEAPLDSGALITARYARDENREVLCVPHALNMTQGVGCNSLIAEGAQMIVDIKQVPSLLGFSPLAISDREYHFGSAREQLLHQALLARQSLDIIQQQLGLTPGEFFQILSKLMLRGYVTQHADGTYTAH